MYYMLLHNALLQGFKGALGDKMKKKKYVWQKNQAQLSELCTISNQSGRFW